MNDVICTTRKGDGLVFVLPAAAWPLHLELSDAEGNLLYVLGQARPGPISSPGVIEGCHRQRLRLATGETLTLDDVRELAEVVALPVRGELAEAVNQ